MSGSPPRTWGRLWSFTTVPPSLSVHPHARGDDDAGPSRCPLRHRFTPTHVGTIPPGSSRASPGSVHPHARGDDHRLSSRIGSEPGSPPRAWGRSQTSRPTPGLSRFTPTHVGTMPAFGEPGSKFPVHPHARGDDGRLFAASTLGLSRFTPTHVGTMDSLLSWLGSVCGSPPRTWGRSFR